MRLSKQLKIIAVACVLGLSACQSSQTGQSTAQDGISQSTSISGTFDAQNIAFSTFTPDTPGVNIAGSVTLKIPMSDGVELEVSVDAPNTPGPHPLIVMPSPWGYQYFVYSIPAWDWRDDGYIVVSYTYRGYGGSDGLADFGGERSIKDLSEIINWALANTNADPSRIGAGGMSYGAFLTLLAAATDSRIKAVFALSGMTDVERCLYPNQTVTYKGLSVTEDEAGETIVPQLASTIEQLRTGNLSLEAFREFTQPRSSLLQLDALNSHAPAIFQTVTWSDRYCSPQQHIDFYQGYSGGPQALHIQAGDHVSQEVTALIGRSNTNWINAKRWVDHFVKGEPLVEELEVLHLETVNTTRTFEDSTIENIFNKRELELQLTAPSPEDQGFFSDNRMTGALRPNTNTVGWEYTIQGATETGAEADSFAFSSAIQGFIGFTPSTTIEDIDRIGAGVWRGDTLTQAQTVAGSPTVALSITPSRNKFTVVAYLYDEDEDGDAELITHGVQSIRGVLPSQAQQVQITLNPILWDVRAGNRHGQCKQFGHIY